MRPIMYGDKKAIMKKNHPLRGIFSAAFHQQHVKTYPIILVIILKLLETPAAVAGGFTNVCFF